MKKIIIGLLFLCLYSYSNINADDNIIPVSIKRNVIVLEAQVNKSKKADFALDTGMVNMMMDSTFFYSSIDTTGMICYQPYNASYYWEGIYKGNFTVKIGDNTIIVNKITVSNFKHPRYKALPVVGIIGWNVVKDKITHIDLEHNQMSFLDSWIPDSTYTELKLFPSKNSDPKERHLRFVNIGFKTLQGKTKKGRFLLDTGHWNSMLTAKTEFAKNLLIDTSGIKRATVGKFSDGSDIENWICNIDSVEIGDLVISDVVFQYSAIERDRISALKGGDGLLGTPLLMLFDIVLDYKNNMLYLKSFSKKISQ